MKACLINDFPKTTGAGKYAFSLLHELQKLDPQIEMHYFGAKKEKGVNNIELDFRLPFLDRTLKSIYFVPKKVPKGHDLFHATNQFLSNVALQRKPCVVTCLDIIPLTQQKDFPFVLSQFLKKSIDGLKHADRVLAISEFTKKELVEKLGIAPGKIDVTYLGFDKAIFRKKPKLGARKALGFDENKKIVLNVGSEEPRKGVKTALEAFKLSQKEFPQSVFVRVGEKTAKIQTEIKKLGLEKKVVYFKGVSEEQLALLYNSADALLFCSRQEGFGLPLLEASACGLPIVCHDNSSIKEVTGKNAFFAKEYSAQGFAEELKKALGEKALAKKFSMLGQKNGSKFSWKKCAEQTLKAYKKVLS